LYSTSYHLYALSGFLICLIVTLVVSILARLCIRQYKPVEPLLLHPLVRGKEVEHHNHAPYTLNTHMQPYYGSGRHNPEYSESHHDGWDDTHFRWPSPSLPPTLKKGQKGQFGTLDKGHLKRVSPGKGRINYGFSTPEKHSAESTSSTNGDDNSISDENDVIVDDFGDEIKVPRKVSESSKRSSRSRSKIESSDDEDGWTTEF
jgi:hypothetical protein